jgi:hypothetical protein
LIPSIIGASDGSLIRVAPPKRNEQSYFNRKSFHSVFCRPYVTHAGTLCPSVYRCGLSWAHGR